MLTHYVSYHKDKYPDLVDTPKTDPVYAAHILINCISLSLLQQNFCIWTKRNKEAFLKMIMKELVNSDEDLNSFALVPLLETEKNCKKLGDNFLKKTFTQLIMVMATIYHNSKESKEDNKSLTNMIKNMM